MRAVKVLFIAATFAAFTSTVFAADVFRQYRAVSYGHDGLMSVGYGSSAKEAQLNAYRECFIGGVKNHFGSDPAEGQTSHVSEAIDVFEVLSVRHDPRSNGFKVDFYEVNFECFGGVILEPQHEHVLTLAACDGGRFPYVSVAVDVSTSLGYYDMFYENMSPVERATCVVQW